MNYSNTNRVFALGALGDSVLNDPFGYQSRQELVRDEVVLSPPISSDERLAKGIREMVTKPADVEEQE